MTYISKGRSPFYPGQPVPIEFFSGRLIEIEQIARSLRQVELGKPQAIYLTGEYGIGKSSLAGFMRDYGRRNHNILGIHVLLGEAETVEDVATKTVEAVIKGQVYDISATEKVRNFLSKYIASQELFGISINLSALKADGPSISHGYLPFLRELLSRVKDHGIQGVMLILDEINGIARRPQFAHFLKGLIDENALSPSPVPLLLMLCGVEERRREIIQHHPPVERIFDIIEVRPMDRKEMEDFFSKTFTSVRMKVEDEAMQSLCHYSAGFPKIMHVIGDAVFWMDQDGGVDAKDARDGILLAAEDVGKKFVDHQVYRALRSEAYHSILTKLAKDKFDLSFHKKTVEKGLSPSEITKFNNFLQRMKKLKVLRSGDVQGEYVFNSRLVRLYILLRSLREK
jgi:hypothetical protein